MAETIHVFLKDTCFIDKANAIRTGDPTSPVGIPSVRSRSYFSDVYLITDPRSERPWVGVYEAFTKPELLIDNAVFSSFIATLSGSGMEDDRASLFNIIDRLTILLDGTDTEASLETELTGDNKYSIYTPGSLDLSTDRILGTIYGENEEVAVEGPTYVQFSTTLSGDAGQSVAFIKVWFANEAFEGGYPVSEISGLVPPTTYQNLMTGLLTGTGSNIFNVSSETMRRTQGVIGPKITSGNMSGYVTQNITLVDNVNSPIKVPFGILYHGNVPDLLSIRTRIRADVLGSGVGSEALWRSRIPELFITDQLYIVPVWDVTTTIPSGGVVHPAAVSGAQLLENVKLALAGLSSEYIDSTWEITGSYYDTMTLVAVPHPENIDTISIRSLHPTYTELAPGQSGFNTMSEKAREFSNKLAEALAVASGNAVNPLYEPRLEGDITYIPFVVNGVEYYVMSKASYLGKVS